MCVGTDSKLCPRRISCGNSFVSALPRSQTFIKLDEIASNVGTMYAKNTADEIFHCTKDLFKSQARTTGSNELFPFSTVTNPSSPSQLVPPTGISMDNRDENGMITSIGQRVYTMGTTPLHTTINSGVSSATVLYGHFWRNMPEWQKGDLMEPGNGEWPMGPYSGADHWKNKYYFADKALEMLKYLVEDKAPQGAHSSFLASLWGVIRDLNTLDTSFTGDDKAYARHFYNLHYGAITGAFKDMQYGYDIVFGEQT